MTTHEQTLVGAFNDKDQARQAIHDLRQAGFSDDRIGMVTQDKDGAVTTDKGTHAGEGAVIGAAVGAGVGAWWALGIAANMLPGIGPVVSGGIIASLLASAAGGAAIAGVAGALIGLGIPEEEAHYYEGELKSGRTLVTVKAGERAGEAWAIMHKYGAYRRDTAVNDSARANAGQTIKVHEERLHATKAPVETGEVHVRKEVVTEQKTLAVPVTREEVVIERRPVTGQASSADIHPGEEIRIPVMEERAHVQKEAVVTEEVNVGKRKVTETETVGGAVRKEQVKVETKGDAAVRGDTSKTTSPR